MQTKLSVTDMFCGAGGSSLGAVKVAAVVSPDELARLDERRLIYPVSPAYAADHWRRVLQGLDKTKGD